MVRHYKIIPEEALMIKVIEGQMTIQEMIDESEEFFNDPLFDKSYYGVMDLRRAQSKVSKLEFFKYSRYLDATGNLDQAKWAVITNSPILVALSQVFQRVSRSGARIGVYNTVKKASEFIERPTVHHYLND